MVGWQLRLDGREFEQTLGDAEGHGSPACCSPRGDKESDTTEQLDSARELILFRCGHHTKMSAEV